MHYYIDGYNLLFRVKEKFPSLQKERDQFLKIINNIASSSRMNLTIVFDGSYDRLAETSRGHFGDLEVIYTSDALTADEYIIEELSHAKNPVQHTVVTSDNTLARHCKSLGAHVKPIEDFLAFLFKKRTKKKSSAEPKAVKDTDAQIARLLRIFENRSPNSDI